MPGDQIFIYSDALFKKDNFVTIEGKIKSPGQYTLKKEMTITDLILEAGGVEVLGGKI